MRGGGARASRRGGSLGHSSFDLGDQMECKAWIHCGWHAGVPDLALGCADAVESVEEARDVEGRLGVERSAAVLGEERIDVLAHASIKPATPNWFTSKLEYR